jgi:preprotein translocase subunit SecA
MITETVSDTFDFCFSTEDGAEFKPDEFSQQFRGLLTDGRVLKYSDEELNSLDLDTEKQKFIDKAIAIYESKDELFSGVEGAPENAMREVEKVILLRNVDLAWMDHLEAMEDLKGYVGLNSYAQRDPVAIYKLESADMFDKMSAEIREKTVKEILSVVPRRQATERVQVAKETGTANDGSQPKRRPVVTKGRVVGRNEYCPCGSGKKYKNCCWSKDQAKQ